MIFGELCVRGSHRINFAGYACQILPGYRDVHLAVVEPARHYYYHSRKVSIVMQSDKRCSRIQFN